MDGRIDAVCDHVAVAVADLARASRRWRDQLGGGHVYGREHEQFRFVQYRYANAGKLELLAPPDGHPDHDFVRRFLDRFGSHVHHLTLKVPDIEAALATIRAGGLDIIDARDLTHWREGFLRPSQVGGLVVQVAWSDRSDEDWAGRGQQELAAARADAPALIGPLLCHPDLDHAGKVWRLLGAEIEEVGGGITCHWPASPLTVRVEQGEPAGPVALRFAGTRALAADADLGPAVEPV